MNFFWESQELNPRQLGLEASVLTIALSCPLMSLSSPGNDLNATLQGAAQKMGQLIQILDEKEEQLMKMRAAKESEVASKDHELEELAKKVPGRLKLFFFLFFLFFNKRTFPASFSIYFCLFYNTLQLTMFVKYLPMSGFEPGISSVGSDGSANCATTTALVWLNFIYRELDNVLLLPRCCSL